ncbi:phosphate ABC transporter substrate-binding protein PstS [Oscillatoria sp. FACHB-1407]|uniref:phosphate ABC transporter substrate-binding protein PstS n=1 Tax=Oscillatoria sp. FACHB-1407 TaxID=2692847 RepID=UPI0016838124|nr:phosphate ABC transporter substrate-binding protein PstS [Oscillatoria sp. FACHB-1407]MBD2464510.1 phosphate ABC transporter substrate-binding protein PstS [Oscillatoria sp. FACHB-1407]
MVFSNILRSKILRRILLAVMVAAAIALSPVLSTYAQSAISLNGAGATFPAPLYERYFSEFTRANPNIRVNYQAIGSGGGIRQTIAETVDFGGSDAAMTDAQIAQVDRGIILVPTAGGAVSITYNLPGIDNLRLSRSVYPDIFSGRITRWNDPRIVADNPGVNLPDLPIRTAVRADGSGTTFIFTNNLSAVSPYFRGRIGVGTAPRWTTNPITGRGNPGVAAQVARTRGAIGYVEYAYAKQNNLQVASLENKAGQFVAPSLQATEEALSAVEFPDNFRVFVGDPDRGYPISGLTWLMVYRQYEQAGKAAAIKRMVEWILTDGQEINNTLDYLRIPEAVARRAIETVNREVTGP